MRVLAIRIASLHLVAGLYFSLALGAWEPAVALYVVGAWWSAAALSQIEREEAGE